MWLLYKPKFELQKKFHLQAHAVVHRPANLRTDQVVLDCRSS